MSSYGKIFIMYLSILCLSLLISCRPTDKTERVIGEVQTPTLPVEEPNKTYTASPTHLASGTAALTTVIPTNQMTTTTQTTTSVLSRVNMGRLFFARYEFYGWFELIAQDSPQGLIFDDTDEYHMVSSRELLDGPGQSTYQVFSHYSDRIAYWKAAVPGELWVSDVIYQEPLKILSDSEGAYVPNNEGARLSPRQFIEIAWAPDDLHVFLYNRHEPELSRVYDLETGELESWYWYCNTLILSSRTGKLATLCPKVDGVGAVNRYAVLEWGGEIWFSDDLPGVLFLESLPDGTAFWQWSADGKWISYFDPHDNEGYLFISDARGNVRRLLPRSSPFRKVEGIKFQQYEFYNNEVPFRWSHDGTLLLINGFGQPDQPCPRMTDEEYGTGRSFEWHCWQLVDVNKGNVLWNEADLARHLFSFGNEGERMPLGVKDIAFAPNGKALAIHTTYMLPRIIAVDLQTFEPTIVNEFDRFDRIYWGGG